VAAALSNTRGPEATRRAALLPHLLQLHEVYRACSSRASARGAVDFDTTETQIVCDENGRIEKIVPRVRNDAHRLIEEAMLAANVCAADFINVHQHPCLFRVHEGPTPEKRLALQNYLKALGIGLSLSEEPTPAEFQAIAEATKDRVDAAQIHTMLLRSMQQALYTPVNSGHFGLAYEAYAHFTSPIRRYPDLLVHRVLKAILAGKRYHLGKGELGPAPARKNGAHQGPDGGDRALGGRRPALQRQRAPGRRGLPRRGGLAQVPLHARAPGRGVQRLGDRVTSFGVFVTLDALYVEGLVHITELGASTSASTRCARSCAASAPACATPSAPGCASRSAAWIWMGGASTSAWCARARRCAPVRPVARGGGAGPRAAGKKASEELAELEAADRVHKRATKAARSKPGRPPARPRAASAKGGGDAERGAGAGRKSAGKRR
jgi:ribonuclease R